MRRGVLAFLLGILVLQTLPELPARSWALALPLVLLLLPWSGPWLRWPACALAGFLWALLLESGLGSAAERAAILESLLAFKRAGADGILSYSALEAARWIRESV